MAINYGAEKIRFTSAVPVGCKIRVKRTLLVFDEVQNGVKILIESVIEIEGLEKPACIAELIFILYK
jgi:acyl dehydratase